MKTLLHFKYPLTYKPHDFRIFEFTILRRRSIFFVCIACISFRTFSILFSNSFIFLGGVCFNLYRMISLLCVCLASSNSFNNIFSRYSNSSFRKAGGVIILLYYTYRKYFKNEIPICFFSLELF